MSLNWKEINVILAELDLAGAHVQQVRQPDYSSLILDLFRPGGAFSVYVSLAPGAARLHRLTRKIGNPKVQPRFSEFLRSRIRGGKIVDAVQIGTERIIRIEVSRSDGNTLLWIRLWGGASNILATDSDGTILETFYRRPGRNEISGGTFTPPQVSAEQSQPAGTGPERFSTRDLPGDGSFNSRIEAFYFDQETRKTDEQLARQALQLLAQRENRIRSLLSRLTERSETFSRYSSYKETGDLILSNLHKISKGDTWITVEDYYHENATREIELDPELSPRENADKYFKKYHKGKSGLSLTLEEIRNQERMLSDTRAMAGKVEAGEDVRGIVALLREDLKAAPAGDERTDVPGLSFRSGEFTILVGRTAKENDALLRKFVRGNDMWLHARDYPGAYVFIRHKPGKSVPLDVLLDAGNLALFYSKGRNSGQGDLYYTFAKYLRRAKDGKPGLVLPTQEKNLHVKLDDARLEKLQNG